MTGNEGNEYQPLKTGQEKPFGSIKFSLQELFWLQQCFHRILLKQHNSGLLRGMVMVNTGLEGGWINPEEDYSSAGHAESGRTEKGAGG